jgi:hypothetical protein
MKQLPVTFLTPESKLPDFIRFFKSIPADKWCINVFTSGDKCCARGHVGARDFNTVLVDRILCDLAPEIAGVNNGYINITGEYDSTIPSSKRSKGIKTRVIKYLQYLNNSK